ncbi:hypothetical protein F5Y10DRAFT_228349 [Nemania abortiva]|nr:hypothetical protein F5Y10DRAFT_228349 [Nemania abortiva]
MASTDPSVPGSPLLAVPLEIRRHIYSFCVPHHLTFDCSADMYYQNRPVGWIEPPWHSNESCEGYTSYEEDPINLQDVFDKESPTNEGGSDCGRKAQSRLFEQDDHDLFSFSSYRSAFPALLLLCRQITHEVETMLYERNTFVVDIHSQNEHTERQFSRRNQELMRNIILILRPVEAPYQPDSLLDPDIWNTALGNLMTLGVILEQPKPPILDWIRESEKEPSGDFPTLLQNKKRAAAGQWMTWLLPVFEYLVRTIPEQTEIVVDVTEEDDTMQALEYFQKGPFRFQRLPTADSIPNRVGFAWESGSMESWDAYYDDGPTSCRDIINDSDYEYYYSD